MHYSMSRYWSESVSIGGSFIVGSNPSAQFQFIAFSICYRQSATRPVMLVTMADALSQVFAYHETTKHHLNRYARGPGGLDWATQPDPFRRYAGASVIPLEHLKPSDRPLYEPVFIEGKLPIQPLSHRTISQLFYDSLALSAWKQVGDVRWPLRVNPSSGNLHPTEGYLVCGLVDGLCI